MNNITLYQRLYDLSQTNDAFFLYDRTGPDGYDYRVFSYRLASYTDFLNVGALESRGIAFRKEGDAYKLVSRPMEKFFNLNENPFTMDLDLDSVEYIMVKEDGWLISTFTDAKGNLCLKSKTSFESTGVEFATTWLTSRDDLLSAMATAECDGYTINCEWLSPRNRIVIPYPFEALVVLNARHRETGNYMDRHELVERFGDYAVKLYPNTIETAKHLKDSEGIVAFMGNSAPVRFVKVKADAYVKLHALKSGVQEPGPLFEAVMEDVTDDLRASLAQDELAIEMINLMERITQTRFNAFASRCNETYSKLKHLDRRDFMIALNDLQTAGKCENSVAGVCREWYVRTQASEDRLRKTFSKHNKVDVIAEYNSQLTVFLSELQVPTDSVG